MNHQSFLPYLNLASARAAVLMLLRAAAASIAAVGRQLRGSFVIFCFFTAALLLCAVLLTSQVLFVGGLDRLGIAPQHSFLALNLLLIAALTAFTLYPVVTSRRQAQAAFPSQHSTVSEATVNPVLPIEPICKLLIMRRLATRKDGQPQVLQSSKKRDNNDEIPVRNWLCGS